MAANYDGVRSQNFSITHFVVRLVVGAIVLAITAALTPGFSISGIWSLVVATVVLAALDYLVSRLFKVNATPFGRGIAGFVLAAVIIYLAKYLVVGYNVTLWGALLGALIYGIVDAIIPGRAM